MKYFLFLCILFLCPSVMYAQNHKTTSLLSLITTIKTDTAHQADEQSKQYPAGEGTGVRLSMNCDIITKEHNGAIRVESKEGEGTRFIITLPQ